MLTQDGGITASDLFSFPDVPPDCMLNVLLLHVLTLFAKISVFLRLQSLQAS